MEFGAFNADSVLDLLKKLSQRLMKLIFKMKGQYDIQELVTHGPDSYTAIPIQRNVLTTKESFGIFMMHYTRIKVESTYWMGRRG